MRSEDLFEVLNDIEDEDIADAQEYSATKKKGSIACKTSSLTGVDAA